MQTCRLAPTSIIRAHNVRNYNRVTQEKPCGILVNGKVLYTGR